MRSSIGTTFRLHITSLIVTTLLAGVVSVGLTLLQPREYRSSFSVLIIEKNASLDGYAASKSAEQLSLALARVVGTASFADQVAQQLDAWSVAKGSDVFPSDEQARRDAWEHYVETRTSTDAGLVRISAFDRDRFQAEALAKSLSVVVMTQGREYLGRGESVEFRIVDTPLTSKVPVRPNPLANVALGLLVGFAIAAVFAVIRDALNRPSDVSVPSDGSTNTNREPVTQPTERDAEPRRDVAPPENLPTDENAEHLWFSLPAVLTHPREGS